MNESIHIPVLLNEVIEALKAREGGMFLDCTFGGGGHTEAILKSHPENRVVGCDRDLGAITKAENKFKGNQNLTLIHTPFSNITAFTGSKKFSGILADLGMSTDQLKGDRGFSFEDASPLDMRMDSAQNYSAQNVVNDLSEQVLYVALKRGGVGQEARKVAKNIVTKRPINNTRELARAVRDVASRGKDGKLRDAATVVFQAIRIEVNSEFSEIQKLLESLSHLTQSGSRVAIISFHSLEDEIVTKKMRQWASGETAPAWMGGSNRAVSLGRLITKKAITPSEAEVEANPASRSARLRVFEFTNGS